jgi:hypothetical protein
MAAMAGLGCGGDDEGSGGGGTGGSAPALDTATIELTGAQNESWSFNSDDNDLTCIRGTDSLDLLIRRSASNADDRVLVKLASGFYAGPDTYSFMAMSASFDQQVIVGVGSMFEYETDLIGDAVASCTLTTTEPGGRLVGDLSCTDIPSAIGSADTPSDPNEPHPTVDVTMSLDCQRL